MKKNISILGSTGSIGSNVFKIIDKKKDIFNFDLLSANKNYLQICKQLKKYKPKYFVINNANIFRKIKKKFKKTKVKIINDFSNLKFKKKSDITISAIPGIDGLKPTLNLIKSSKKILIANKESIICGWKLINLSAKKYKTKIIPVDSEHFSIYEILKNHKHEEIKKIYLTASGGPFLNLELHKFSKIKPKDALKHPRWKMGRKISIDSATLMNKILELVEAQKLFNLEKSKLDIIIHPQSLVHAIIEFKNGLAKFIYHDTSMIIPLSNAIFNSQINIDKYFKKKRNKSLGIRNLTFETVDKKKFPMINLKKRIFEYPSSSIIINAANEILVDQFLQKKIAFMKIYKIILTVLNDRNYKKYAIRKPKNINQIIDIDMWARKITSERLK